MRNILSQTKLYIVLLLSILVIVAWTLVLGSRPISGDTTPIRVVIARGTSAGGIASILREKRLIRSSLVFSLTCRLSGTSNRLRPGVYELNRMMGIPEIVKKLVNGESLEVWVTIPEGFTVRQIADSLQAKELADGEAFRRIALTEGYEFPSYSFVYGHNLEGYLFPDTYLVARGTDSEGIVRKMLDAFERKVVIPHRSEISRVVKSRFGLDEESFARGLHGILTIASIVEREAKTDKDRGLVAAVMWNRLRKNMRLEVDATVTYSPGESSENKARVYYRDLRNDSPYNTYRHKGLPPAPICNPGIASIKAVLDPAQADYLYYVARKDGTHVFSNTLEEHQAATKAIRGGGQ